jgi:3-hydroxyisobutyrate dehydrogenase-like beta-hydroxyacid dehydrogenase
MKIGLVGLGRMGAAIAQRLNERGCEVTAWDRNPKAREAQARRGLRIVDSPRAVADEADVVLSIITEDKGVRQIFVGPDGFLSAEIKGKLFIEMSTLQPMTHRELAPVVKARGAHLVDSPVMGSIPTVREGRLLALLGGDAADVERARSVLDHLTRRIVHIGPNGAGCAMKLAVNLGMAVYLQSLAEAMSLGASEGLKLDQIRRGADREPLAQGQARHAQGRAGRHHARHPHHAQGRHVGDRDRRAQRRRHAGHVRYPCIALRRRRRWLGRQGSRRGAALFPRVHAAGL